MEGVDLELAIVARMQRYLGREKERWVVVSANI
jgi:hypothetical protein